MQNRDNSFQEAMRLAQSPAGQQLIRLLQQSGGYDVQQAMESAAAGDFSQAKQLLSALIQDPKARELLQQLGGNHG